MSNPKKILTLGHSYCIALNRTVMRELARNTGMSVTVVCPRFFHGDLRDIHVEPEPLGSPLRVIAVDVYLSKSIHLFFYNPSQIHQILSQEHFDEAILWEEPYIVSGYQIARKLNKVGIPFSFYSCQNIFKKYPFPFRFFESRVFSWAKSLLACGRLVEDTHRAKGFTQPSEVVPFFVDSERFQPLDPAQKIKLQQEKGLQPFVIGFMGRWTAEKGCSLFMRVLDRIPKEKGWSALILGSGPMETEFRQWIARNNYSERVQLKSLKHDDVPQWLPLCDALLCPSQTTLQWKEQFGRMLIEGFSSGVPIIASRSGEIPFVVDDAGILVDENDEEAWLQQVIQLMDRPELQEKLRDRGLKRSKIFSAKAIAQQYFNLLK
ncbi:MAG: glycosyltransferase [Bdellovibrionales bacterium]|nr:glycosyltransferase [Bdellovibrionales bacterium]